LKVLDTRRSVPGASRKFSSRLAVALAIVSTSFLYGVVIPSTHAVADGSIYPIGTSNSGEPSGYGPPAANALSGYTESYVNDFTGSSLPSGWTTFSGQPSSDPGALWKASDVVVGSGVLALNATESNGAWSTGGVCQCNVDDTYGAFFVRSRLTGAGPTQVELLWPAVGWPPEIDFNETFGATDLSTATLHYSSSNSQVQQTVSIDMTQWHTWGVIWTPSSVIYTVDGTEWGEVSNSAEIPDQPMTLDIQQQTWCASDWACPTSDESTYVDWVAEYTAGGTTTTPTTPSAPSAPSTPSAPSAPSTPAAPSAPAPTSPSSPTTTTTGPTIASTPSQTVVLGPFESGSSALSGGLKSQIAELASKIKREDALRVKLVGYSDSPRDTPRERGIGIARAKAVAKFLRHRLEDLKVRGARIAAVESGIPKVRNRVVASIS
jgi:outer membrane protein OmpA-like peptidoglycan-associated protein